MKPSPDNPIDVRRDRFGRYRLRGVLGQGGMGRLYVAEQNAAAGAPKIVALKRILPHLADSPQLREMFLNEARVATRLKHRNIVETYESGEIDGACFISMEYLSGEDLAAVLALCPEGKAMPLEIVLTLIQQCAEGLHYAHEARDAQGQPQGLVHRDVNPWNIFVTYYGVAKLLDFGIVKAANGTRTAPGVFKGKYAYSAPEQFSGATVDRQVDVFSLGIVLWECLTGRKLFDGPSEVAIIDGVRSRPISPPSAHRPEVPPALDNLVMAALERDRERRLPSARHLAHALGLVLASGAVRSTGINVGVWLQTLFGQERAALRNAISHGANVETSVARLAALGVTAAPVHTDGQAALSAAPALPSPVAAPRSLWSTSAGVTPPPISPLSPATAPGADAPTPAHGVPVVGAQPSHSSSLAPGRRRRLEAAVSLLAVALVGFGVTFASLRGRTRKEPASEPTSKSAELSIRTEPPGAHIMIDGEPSGLTTPATLTGLRVGRKLQVRLERPGYRAAVRSVEISAGRSEPLALALLEATGRVHLRGLPAGASVYVDDNAVAAEALLTVELGRHRLRIEAADDVLMDEPIEVQPGEQTVTIAAARKKP